MSVRQRLASLGESLGDFNQGDFSGGRSKVDDVEIGGGYCAGVALDWARRVLQSGTRRPDTYLAYRGEKTAVGGARHGEILRRMTAAYAGQSASYVATTEKTALVPKLKELAATPDAKYVGGSVGVQVPRAVLAQVRKFIDFGDEVVPDVVPRQRIQGWHDFVLAGDDPQHEARAAAGREWSTFADDLDRQFKAGRTKTFGKIAVLRSRELQVYASEGVWLGVLERDGTEDAGCTIVYLAPPERNGHVVAVHQVDNTYRFFDPNYGVYKYTQPSLMSALQHLFWSPLWKNDEGLDPDLPVYQRRKASQAGAARDTTAWTRMAYTVFKAKA